MILAELMHGGKKEAGKKEGGWPWCPGTGDGLYAHLIPASLLHSISKQPLVVDDCQHVYARARSRHWGYTIERNAQDPCLDRAYIRQLNDFINLWFDGCSKNGKSYLLAGFSRHLNVVWVFLSGSAVKNSPAVQKTQEIWVRSLGREDPLEDGMTTHSSILPWRIPWAEEPTGL